MTCVIVFHDCLMPDKSMAGLLAHALNTMMIAVTLIVVAVPEGPSYGCDIELGL